MGDTWHDACMPCGFVQSIKTGSVEEKRGTKMREKEREGGRKEDPQLLPLNSDISMVGVRKAKS